MQASVPPEKPKDKTRWDCEACGKSGVVETEKGIDVMGGIRAVKDAHAKASPECRFDYNRVKVISVERLEAVLDRLEDIEAGLNGDARTN
jgi:hypothetical protein